jgi:thiol-disulfide isomerase/thioredoxin
MSQKLLMGLLVLLACAVGAFHGFIKASLDPERVEQMEDFFGRATLWHGRYPPDFELETLAGETFQLAEYVGKKVVVLNFFATWCEPCRTEMPELERFHQAHRERPLLLIGIDVEESRSEVEGFVRELGVTFPVGLDTDGSVASSFQVDSYPTTVLIGIDGRIYLYETGAILNADVAFSDLLSSQQDLLESGGGVTRERYLEVLAEQPELGVSDFADGPKLTGRAREIAEKMACPCGCEQQVLDCSCSTADKITTRLGELDLDERDDDDVIRELNKEFCVGVTG